VNRAKYWKNSNVQETLATFKFSKNQVSASNNDDDNNNDIIVKGGLFGGKNQQEEKGETSDWGLNVIKVHFVYMYKNSIMKPTKNC
jgi:hypothetical protein